MSEQVRLTAAAEADLREAFEYYEFCRAGLGREFLSEFDSALEIVARHPGGFRLVHKHVRRTMMRKFPFGIYYVERDHLLTVIAVFHAARDPRGWKRRTND